jgi:hypothetical protein
MSAKAARKVIQTNSHRIEHVRTKKFQAKPPVVKPKKEQ